MAKAGNNNLTHIQAMGFTGLIKRGGEAIIQRWILYHYVNLANQILEHNLLVKV
jgi:hypothetical protein